MMNQTNRCIYTTLLFLLFLISQQGSFAQQTQVEARVDSIMKQHHMIGLSVAVVKKNKMMYTHSFGLKNRESNTPLNDSDLFRIASISKSFSATSIMQLVEAKKLSLDDDVSKLIGFTVRNPNFPDKVITLKMLMSHTSSLNDSKGYYSLDIINPNKNADYAKCYNHYAPGAGYQYCNLNYNITGTIVEKTSGERFDKYIKHHILDPLHLYGGYEIAALDSNRFVTLYNYDTASKSLVPSPDAYQQNQNVINHYTMGYSTPVFSPTGGMKISATDLAKYMTMHMNYGKYKGVRIMSKKSAKTMQTKVSDGGGGYGLALYIVNDIIPGKQVVGHLGEAYGLFSMMFFEPKEKFGIVVITNGDDNLYKGNYNVPLLAVLNVLYNEMIAKKK